MTTFDAPKIEYFTVSPILIVLGVAVIGVLIEAFVPRAPSLRPCRSCSRWSAWSRPS